MAGPIRWPDHRSKIACQQPIAFLPFGPATVVSSTGARSRPAVDFRIRFYYPTRGEGQV